MAVVGEHLVMSTRSKSETTFVLAEAEKVFPVLSAVIFVTLKTCQMWRRARLCSPALRDRATVTFPTQRERTTQSQLIEQPAAERRRRNATFMTPHKIIPGTQDQRRQECNNSAGYVSVARYPRSSCVSLLYLCGFLMRGSRSACLPPTRSSDMYASRVISLRRIGYTCLYRPTVLRPLSSGVTMG